MRTIAFDLSSGDNGSTEAIKAAVDFSLSNKDWKVVGFIKEDEQVQSPLPENFTIVKCSEVIDMEDGPMQVRRKTESTLVKAIDLVLKGEASAVVSAAASGPLVAAGYLFIKPMEGTKPAFAPIFKNVKGKQVVSLDIGANIDIDAKTLEQYGVMGSIYAKALSISDNPEVKLLNIGTEDKKGTQMHQDAFELLSNNQDVNFKGNAESSELLIKDGFDVIVTDAFSGNIALKAIEGTFYAVRDVIKESVDSSVMTKIGIGVFSKKFQRDFKAFVKGVGGGAIVLGLNELLIKTHGGSDYDDYYGSLNTAKILIEKELIKNIREAINK